MSLEPCRGAARRTARKAAAIILVLVVSVSCASKPKPTSPAVQAAPALPVQSQPEAQTEAAPSSEPQAASPPAVQAVALPAPIPETPVPQAAAPVTAQKQEGGTALKTADPAALARVREEREAIETSIVFGSPSSLAKARESASHAAALKAEDAAVLNALARGVEALAYPEAADVPPRKGSAAEPLPLAKGLLQALGEASAGRFPVVPAEYAGTPLGELIPALALFSSDSSETARKAFEALERFARLGVPSIMPSIIRGVDAERRGEWQDALSLYRSALAIAPDAWCASLGSGRALLAQKRFADALNVLSPLSAAHSGLTAFDRPYALALSGTGRYTEAEPYVARVLTRDPQDSRFILMRARLLLLSKSYQQALPLLEAYGTVDPSNRLYLLLRAIESEALRARDEAIKWARRGLAAYPDDPELLVVAARLLFSGPAFGREEARTLAARAYELTAPGRPAVSDSDSETASALQAARTAAGVESARLLALDAASRSKWTEAAVYLTRAGSAFGDKALAARILRNSGDAKAALEYSSLWYRAEPRSEPAIEAYLRSLIDMGDDKAAQEIIARVLPGVSSSPFRSLLYYLQSRLQKSDEAALTLLRSALVENADNSEALAAVSDLQLRRKDFSKARFYLKQAMAIDPDNPELEARQKQLDALAPQ
jgi:tetratricopeptide (TPR) repeat protein